MIPSTSNDHPSNLTNIPTTSIMLIVALLISVILLAQAEFELPVYVVLGLLGIFLSIRHPNWAIVLCLTTLPLDQILNPEAGSNTAFLSPFRLFQMLVLFIQYPYLLINKRQRLAVNDCFIFWCLFLGWAVLTLLWSPAKRDGALDIIKLSIQIAFLHLTLHTLCSRKDLNLILLFNIIFAAFIAYYTLFFGTALVLNVDEANKRLALEGIIINSFAGALGMVVTSAFVYWNTSKKHATVFLVFVFCIPAIIMVILKCGTRSVFIGIPLLLFFVSIVNYWKSIYRILPKLIFVAVIGMLAFIWATKNDMIGEKIVDRLFLINLSDIEESRIGLWRIGITSYLQSPLGTGMGGEYTFLTMTDVGEAHNTFISVMLQTSIIGFILYIIPFFIILKKIWKISDTSMRFGALLIYSSIFVQACRSTLIHNRFLWFYLIIACLFIEIIFKEKQLKEQG